MLISAVNKAYEANEAAMSKIVLKDGLAYYEKLPETKCKTEICNKNWIDILNQNQKDTFVIDKGELIRTFISIATPFRFLQNRSQNVTVYRTSDLFCTVRNFFCFFGG